MTFRIALAVAVLLICELSCTGRGAVAQARIPSQRPSLGDGTWPGVKVGHGIACYVHGSSGYEQLGPPSYRVRDLGGPGVPQLSRKDVAMLHRITRYFAPPTLRFAFIGHELIVFNASVGPCYPGNYMVLNGSCNEAYSPTDNLDHTGATPGCPAAPRPWMPNDPKGGTVPWKDYYTSR